MTTAVGNLSNTSVTANSISHYFATTAAPAIAIVKETNGQVALFPPGPTVFVGTTVTFTYLVSNPGNVPLHDVTIVDDNGTPTIAADDFHPLPCWSTVSTSVTPTTTACSTRVRPGPLLPRRSPPWANTPTTLR